VTGLSAVIKHYTLIAYCSLMW